MLDRKKHCLRQSASIKAIYPSWSHIIAGDFSGECSSIDTISMIMKLYDYDLAKNSKFIAYKLSLMFIGYIHKLCMAAFGSSPLRTHLNFNWHNIS